MRSQTAAALIPPIAVVVAVVVVFAYLIEPVRRLEAATASLLLHLLGVAPEAVQLRANASLAVYPHGHAAFLAVVTPSCSSLSSLLAVMGLTIFTPRRRQRRRIAALACALVCITAGNVVRIAASVMVGLLAGASSLVLFHDWVGSMFAFAYTLGGYLLMLALLLHTRQTSGRGEAGIHVA
ncbi:MAG: archaeosortase/exosortase family protein [Pseudonocardiales bacterium]|nr:archaeosortase/exosortase family protein [Pseudonocardiales bacterium]MBV9729531.1 archaeosortase/exosortase family protein [Pseudonocardiales bacterium]